MRRAAALGLLGGVAWGVAARLFMRLLADEPAFSWSGTLSILVLAGVSGLAVGVVHGARATGRSRWWRLAGLPGVIIFGGLGMLLLPGAVGSALVIAGRRLLRIVGGVLVVGTPVVLASVMREGPIGPAQWLGLGVLTGCVLVQGAAIVDVLRRWRPDSAVEERLVTASPVGATG